MTVTPTVPDLWDHLHPLFDQPDAPDTPVDIHVTWLDAWQIKACIKRFMLHSRTITTNFFLVEKRVPVMALSINAAVDGLTNGQLIGAVMLSLPAMPEVLLVVESSHYFTLSFTPSHWNYISIAAFLDLFQIVGAIAPEASVVIEAQEEYPPEVVKAFADTIEDYLA